MTEYELVCGKCGGTDVKRVGDDAIDYCAECGCIEGITEERELE